MTFLFGIITVLVGLEIFHTLAASLDQPRCVDYHETCSMWKSLCSLNYTKSTDCCDTNRNKREAGFLELFGSEFSLVDELHIRNKRQAETTQSDPDRVWNKKKQCFCKSQTACDINDCSNNFIIQYVQTIIHSLCPVTCGFCQKNTPFV